MPSRRHAIASDLRDRITTGQLKPGDRLPSETQLADQYKVSTATLRSALAALQGEGLIEKLHGKGNFVRRSLRRITYIGGGHARDLRSAPDTALHITVRTTKIRAHGHLTSLLRVSAGSPLTEFLCLSYEAETPHSLARIYIPHDLAPAATPNNPRPQEASASFAALHPDSAEVRETVNARLPTPQEASTLRISTALAVLAITRVTADEATGRVVEAALLVLPGDRADAVFTTNHTIDEGQTER
ncbi:GntR family transcriptional regulator [Streptomyces sp. Je 1-332]|uniref:GntR family transcriptional regulator n=1 Tax=Streptomyces sp. Je 1-332 TaxID=3231270 RepID=UPI003459EF1C